MSRRAAEARGRRGERIAAWWLRFKGWRILALRVRTPAGEVDIVARRGRTLAFVEVKTRPSLDAAHRFLGDHALRRVAAASEALAHRYAREGDDIRIDAILWAPGRWPRHLENVWHG